MQDNIQIVQVRVFKSEYGEVNPQMTGTLTGNERTRSISCGAISMGVEILSKEGDDSGCMWIEPGENVPVLTSNAIETHKMRLPDGGYVWIPTPDYNTFITTCNECCTGS